MSEPFPAECVYLSGPTASGKTAVALELAVRIDAEIVAMDSMTIYRGLDIGTAKPSHAEQAVVPHHLLDIVEPDVEFSQAEYVAAARSVVDEILSRGKVPLFVGGTPLYLKTLLRGMFEGPVADWELRRSLESLAATKPPGTLQEMLRAVDPAAAEKLHANDTRRLVRALEVFKLTGRPISEHQRHFDQVRLEAIGRTFVLDWPREELYRRINERVDLMLSAGLIGETLRLIAAGKSLGRTAAQSLGYCEVLEHLAGKFDERTLAEAIKQNTRRFAKRQMTWFRSLRECTFLPMSAGIAPAGIATTIIERLAQTPAKLQADRGTG